MLVGADLPFMPGEEFRRWAEFSFREYGGDRWFFLRELAQNSRDAGAKAVWVSADRTREGDERLEFADDGCGMSLDHARRYLFRLYASSKMDDAAAAGMYGVGFWTVLRFEPERILIESRTNANSWALELDRRFQVRDGICRLSRHSRSGTRITLVRPAQCPNGAEFQRQVETALRYFCRFLRRNDRRASPLPLFFPGREGRLLTQPIRLNGPVSLFFRRGRVEGAVSIADKPEVQLFARGLPVWRGASLSELSLLPTKKEDGGQEIGPGLAPVFLLNGNDLDITMRRDAAIDNRALDRVRRAAEEALSRLVRETGERAYPRRLFERIAGRCRLLWERTHRPWKWVVAILALALPLEFLLLRALFPAPAHNPTASVFSTDIDSYAGATVSLTPTLVLPTIFYSPAVDVRLKLFTADRYDLVRGFVRGKPVVPVEPAPIAAGFCPDGALTIHLIAAGGGEIFFPQPFGFRVVPSSLRRSGGAVAPFVCDQNGDVRVEVTAGSEWNYRCCPLSGAQALSDEDAARLTHIPSGQRFPVELERGLAESGSMDIGARVEWALRQTTARIVYDVSAETADRYRRRQGAEEWTAWVGRIGAGDCDVLNGWLVLLLRRMRVPARLGVGLLGEGGRVGGTAASLHAWAEYFAGGWRMADATVRTAVASPVSPTGTFRYAPAVKVARRSLGFVPWLVLGILVLSGVRIAFRRRDDAVTAVGADAGEWRRSLSRMALGALMQPQNWGGADALWNIRLLPTIAGRPLSLRQAWKLSKRGRLFSGSIVRPLVRDMALSGIPVLDLGDKAFTELIRTLPGLLDLDVLTALQSVVPQENGADACERFLARANRWLKKISRRAPPCLLATGLGSRTLQDLVPPLSSAITALPIRVPCVAVNSESSELRALASLAQKNPRLALFRFFRILCGESRFYRNQGGDFARRAARHLLQEKT